MQAVIVCYCRGAVGGLPLVPGWPRHRPMELPPLHLCLPPVHLQLVSVPARGWIPSPGALPTVARWVTRRLTAPVGRDGCSTIRRSPPSGWGDGWPRESQSQRSSEFIVDLARACQVSWVLMVGCYCFSGGTGGKRAPCCGGHRCLPSCPPTTPCARSISDLLARAQRLLRVVRLVERGARRAHALVLDGQPLRSRARGGSVRGDVLGVTLCSWVVYGAWTAGISGPLGWIRAPFGLVFDRRKGGGRGG